MSHCAHTVVIGIGNPDRGDDGAGRAVVELLAPCVPCGVELVAHDGEATSLLERLRGIASAVLVDACRSDARPGFVQRFDVSRAPLPLTSFGVSTHGFGLGAAIELARAMGELPPRCVVYAIEAESFAAGAALSATVAAAVADAAGRVLEEIHQNAQRSAG
jgi:hydrogenase maturation protease